MVHIPGWENSEGRKAGCLLLPKGVKSTRFCDRLSDRIEVIPENQWDDYLQQDTRINMDEVVPYVLDQDQVGSCAAEATTGGILDIRNFSGQPIVRLNPYGLYHFSGDGVDRGSNIDVNLRYARELGVPPLDLWPREKGYRNRPSDEAMEAAKQYRIVEFYDIQNRTEFGSALLQGFVVVYGRDGHAILAVYLKDRRTIIFLNSWGNWGREGRGEESIDRVTYGYGVYCIRTCTQNEAPIKLKVSELPPIPKFEPYPTIKD